MRPTKASDSAKQAIIRFEGVRRRDVPDMAVTTKVLTMTAIGAVTGDVDDGGYQVYGELL